MSDENLGCYSNPEFDAVLGRALEAFDEGERNRQLAAATRIAMEDHGIIPLLRQKSLWASRGRRVVTNTVFADADRPSRVVLPLQRS